MKREELTERIIGVFYKVYDSLGFGFFEKIYERALVVEFGRAGLAFERQAPIKVYYDGIVLGDYFADFIVEGKVIVCTQGVPSASGKVKAIVGLGESDGKQLLNYLRATGKRVGLVLNFGREAEIKRKVFG